MNKDNYVFFFMEDANFGFSTILIPLEYFGEMKSKEYKLLNKSFQSCTLTYNNKYSINKLVLIEYKCIDNNLEIDTTKSDEKMVRLCKNILWYANHLGELDHCYLTKEDGPWKDKFLSVSDIDKVNIVDSYIILESVDGEYTVPTYLDNLKEY